MLDTGSQAPGRAERNSEAVRVDPAAPIIIAASSAGAGQLDDRRGAAPRGPR